MEIVALETRGGRAVCGPRFGCGSRRLGRARGAPEAALRGHEVGVCRRSGSWRRK